MKSFNNNLLCIGLSASCCLLFSCGPTKKTAGVKHVTLDSLTVIAKNNPLDIYRASEPRYWDITHADIHLTPHITLKEATGEVTLHMHPYAYPSDTLDLDAKSIDVKDLYVTRPAGAKATYHVVGDRIKIRFDRKFRPADSVHLFISYTAKPYAVPSGGSKAIVDDKGLYFINANNEVPGKPTQVWTQGETEANSHWVPILDQPNERLTFRLTLDIPDTFISLSNGRLLDSKIHQVVGEPGDDIRVRTDVWEMDKPIQPYAMMFAIGKFAVVQDQPWQGKEISYYVEPEYAPYAKQIFNNTPEMVDYFSRITGVPYPWNKYSQIIVRDYVSGAMENTTASLFGEFMHQNHREIADKNYEDVVSHELFHQWFGDYVTAESWSNLTVNESFANYGEQLWRRYRYGRSSNDELAFEDLAKYLNSTGQNDEQLVRFHYHNKEDMFDRISYQKGGAILNYLHGLIGDSAFYRAMNIYLTKNALQPAEAHHWRLAVEEATGLDWNWFFDQWYYRAGHPTLRVQHKYDDKAQMLTVDVRQTPSDSMKAYRLPLKAALIYGDNKEVFDWTVDSKSQRFTYPYRSGMRPVFVPDQTHWLVGFLHEQKKLPEWLIQLTASDDYISKRRAVSTAFLSAKDSLSPVIFRAALKDSLPGIRTHALNLLSIIKETDRWNKNISNEVALLATDDPSPRVRAAAFGVAGSWKIASSKADMIKALSDSSYMVAGAALEALRKIDKDTAYFYTKTILQNNPRADLESSAWGVLAHRGEAADIKLFEEKADYVYGTKKIAFATNLSRFITNTKDLQAYERGLMLLARLAANESIKSYRFGIGSMVFATSRHYREMGDGASPKESNTDVKQRIAIAEKVQQIILSDETDPENLRKYKTL